MHRTTFVTFVDALNARLATEQAFWEAPWTGRSIILTTVIDRHVPVICIWASVKSSAWQQWVVDEIAEQILDSLEANRGAANAQSRAGDTASV